MKYRVASKLYGILDLVVYCLVSFYIFALSDLDSLNDQLPNEVSWNEKLFVRFVIYGYAVCFCVLTVFVGIRLVVAAKEGYDVKLAIEYCNTWLLFSWSTFGVALFSSVVLLYINIISLLDVYQRNQSQIGHFLIVSLILILRGWGLYCVHNYNWELRDALLNTQADMMDSLDPISEYENPNQNNFLSPYSIVVIPPDNED